MPAELASARLMAAAPLPHPQQDPTATKDKAKAILDQPQFRGVQPSWFQKAVQWIGDHLARALGGLFGGGSGSLIAWVIILGLLAGVVLVIVFVGRTVRREPERDEPEARVEIRRTASDWRAEAEALEAKGDWKGALRCRYRALVAELIARRLVRDMPGRTTGEYRADVRSSLPDAGPGFTGATELFERAWYGDRPTGPDESRRFDELARGVVDQARRASAPAAPSSESDEDRELAAP
jgi:Domain of unknown function (DUF4129)